MVKYHTVLHGIFKRAMLDRVIADNPSAPCWPNAVSLKQYPGYSLAVVEAGALQELTTGSDLSCPQGIKWQVPLVD